MHASGVQALLDVSMSYINEARDSSKTSLLTGITDSGDFPTEELKPEEISIISETLNKLFNNKINIEQATQIINPIVGTQHPMQKIAGILSITDEPIPPNPHEFVDNMSRHKTRSWMLYEDQRLLNAILRYGFENWVLIAEFVGNGRTRSQCSQRWNRGLNPKISKGTWSKEEEDKLMRLVSQNGDKSWTKISMEFGNRSDVQCRYRYQQLLKERENCNYNSPSTNRLNLINDENCGKNNNGIKEKSIAIGFPKVYDSQLKEVESKQIILNEKDKLTKESRIQIPPLITLTSQAQNRQTDLPKNPTQHFPSLIDLAPTSIFSYQYQAQNKVQSQENSSLPKISLPKINPSFFNEC